MKFSGKIAALAIATLTTACSGSPSGGGVPTAVATALAPQSNGATARFTLTIPRSAASAARLRKANRTRHYVSFGTRGLQLAVFPAGQSPTQASLINYDLSPTSNLCTAPYDAGAGEQQCTIDIPAPVGNDTFQANTFENTPSQGFAPGTLLSTGTTTQTIVAGQVNTVSIVLAEVVSSVGFGPPRGIIIANQAALAPLAIFAFDAAGDSEPDSDTTPFAAPVSLTYKEFNTTGTINHTSFSINGGFPVGSVTLTKASDAESVTVNYDGQAPLGYYAMLNATIPSVSNTAIGSGLVNPLFLISSASSYYSNNGSAIKFTAAGQSVTITTDLGDLLDSAYPVTYASFAGVGCGSIASVSPLTSGSFPSFTVTSLGGGGSCYVGVEYDQTYSFGGSAGGGGIGQPFNILVSN